MERSVHLAGTGCSVVFGDADTDFSEEDRKRLSDSVHVVESALSDERTQLGFFQTAVGRLDRTLRRLGSACRTYRDSMSALDIRPLRRQSEVLERIMDGKKENC